MKIGVGHLRRGNLEYLTTSSNPDRPLNALHAKVLLRCSSHEDSHWMRRIILNARFLPYYRADLGRSRKATRGEIEWGEITRTL